MVKTTVIADK